MTPELQSKMAIWRAKSLDNTLTTDDQREAVAYMRGERKGAATSSEQSKRTKAKKEVKSADELFKELGI